MRRRSWIITGLLAIVLLVCVSLGTAQDAPTCPLIVEQALTGLGNNCGGLERNSACYGFNRVDATFTTEQTQDFFSQPADRAGLVDLQTIRTVPLDLDLEAWGIAVMNVQANVPGTLPGQAVTFLLLGDAEVQNQVVPETAAIDVPPPVDVTVPSNANIRSAPSTNANIVGGAVAGTTLQADALSADGEWLRILLDGVPAWISRQVVTTDGNLDALPRLTEERRTPMQSFYFRTGIGDPECVEAPSTLLVQGPENVVVDLDVNGAALRIGSTITLSSDTNDRVRLRVLDGRAYVNDGAAIPTGFTAEAAVNPETGEIVSSWGGIRPMTQDELDALLPLANLPASILNYPVNVPTLADIQREQAALRPRNTPVPDAATPEAGAPVTQQAPVVTEGAPVPTGEATAPVQPTVDAGQPSVSFSADRTSIAAGECANLNWSTANINAVVVNGSPAVGAGSQQVCPPQTTTYAMIVTLRDGSQQTYIVTIEVRQASGPVCGDAKCEPGETFQTCSVDCAAPDPVCGNLTCEAGESPRSCPSDCPLPTAAPACGNLLCEAGESPRSCPSDCQIIR